MAFLWLEIETFEVDRAWRSLSIGRVWSINVQSLYQLGKRCSRLHIPDVVSCEGKHNEHFSKQLPRAKHSLPLPLAE